MPDDTPRKTEALSQRIDPQLKADLEELAKRDSRSLANYVQHVLRQHVESTKKKRDK
jgi:predicted HicB family RNase H-like nuclease